VEGPQKKRRYGGALSQITGITPACHSHVVPHHRIPSARLDRT
jgi:hypothetical protein